MEGESTGMAALVNTAIGSIQTGLETIAPTCSRYRCCCPPCVGWVSVSLLNSPTVVLVSKPCWGWSYLETEQTRCGGERNETARLVAVSNHVFLGTIWKDKVDWNE